MLPTKNSYNSFDYLQKSVPVTQSLLEKKQSNELIHIFTTLHPSQSALIIQFLSNDERKQLLEILDDDFNPEILLYLNDYVKKEFLKIIESHELASMLTRLKESDTSEILDDLTDEQITALLNSFNPKYRKAIEKLLNYPEETAGRIMDYDDLSVPNDWTIGRARNLIKSRKDLSPKLSTVFLINEKGAICGQISLSDITRLDKSLPIKNYAKKIDVSFNIYDTYNDIIYAFRQYEIHSAPVLDEDNHLLGVIDITTILDLVYDQAEDNLFSSAGIESSDFYGNILQTSINRSRWLIFSTIGAVFTGTLVSKFVHKDLNGLLTTTMGISGSSSVQVATIIITSLLNKELGKINIKKTIIKELCVAFLNSLLLNVGTSIIFIFMHPIKYILIYNLALTGALLFSSVIAILLPFIFYQKGEDPSSSSSAILNVITDTMSILTFSLITSLLISK